MRTCLVALSLILAIEGYLAWVGGRPQLAALLGAVVLVGGMVSCWKRRGSEWGWAMLVGLYIGAAVLTFGVRSVGLIVATSSLHFVAWFFASRAIRFGAPELIPGTLDGRPGIFSVAFYGAFGLALVLVRGGVFPIGKGLAVILAFSLFVLGLVVMEKGRFLRMREGTADRKSRKRGIAARALAMLALLAGMFFVFSKPVPAVADGVVKMVLDLQGKTEDSGLDADDMPDEDGEFDRVPLAGQPGDNPEDGGEDPSAGGQRAGDSMSQARALPPRANLHGRHIPLVHLEFESEAQAAALARRPVYVRSSTLGRYSEGEWRRVGEGLQPVWLGDAQDGKEDGRVTLPGAFPDSPELAELHYKIYVHEANGAALLALQGVSGFDLPKVQRYDDDWYRARLFGNISYAASSRPISLEEVLGAGELRAGRPVGGGVYLDVEKTRLMQRTEDLLREIPVGSLAERLLWIKQFLATNYRYSQKIDNDDGLAPLENFLFSEKRGYCDFFATAGALMARMIGVPSRIGYGYSQAEFDGQRIFSFFEDGAHSWPEIFLEGYGWVVFDVTPRGESAGDEGERPDPALAGQRRSPDLSAFKTDGSGPGGDGGDGGGDGGKREPAELSGDNSAISDLVSYLIFCAALLAFALWYFLKRDPAREAERADERVAGPGRNLPGYLVEFCRLVQSFGLDPQHGETMVDMLKALRRAGVPVDGFEAMKSYHYRTRYEDEPHDPRLEKRFLQEVRSFLKENLSSGKKSAPGS